MNKIILYICPDYPYPPDSGSRIDMYGRVAFFARMGWLVVIVAVITEALKKYREENKLPLPPGMICYELIQNTQESKTVEIVKKIQELIDYYHPAIVWCEYARFAPTVSPLTLDGARLYFRAHNFEVAHYIEKALDIFLSGMWRTQFISRTKLLRWLLGLGLDCFKIASVESKMHRIAHSIFYISYGDMYYMKRIYRGKADKYWLPPFVQQYEIPVKCKKKVLDVVYLGSNFYNNVNMAGARELLLHIIPAVTITKPGAFRFHLVGRGGRTMLGSFASESVVIHDYIRELQPFLSDMDIACIPTPIGWGCKVKMIEAMACGLPVVGSPQAFRGIPSVDEAFMMCRTTRDYVEALCKLTDPETRNTLSRNSMRAYELWVEEGESLLSRLVQEARGQAC